MPSPMQPSNQPEPPGMAVQDHDKLPAHKKGACILVVDDDRNVRQSLRRQLVAAGFRVRTAADAMEAITVFHEHGADLIVLDVKMPGIDGFEVCETIKKSADVPIIFLTGAQEPIIQGYLPQMVEATGGDHFLRKPCDTRELIKLIRDTLDNR